MNLWSLYSIRRACNSCSATTFIIFFNVIRFASCRPHFLGEYWLVCRSPAHPRFSFPSTFSIVIVILKIVFLSVLYLISLAILTSSTEATRRIQLRASRFSVVRSAATFLTCFFCSFSSFLLHFTFYTVTSATTVLSLRMTHCTPYIRTGAHP
jgi:hypothetical protein